MNQQLSYRLDGEKGEHLMGIRDFELEGFGTDEAERLDEEITITLSGRQCKFVSKEMARIYNDENRYNKDRVSAIGIQRRLDGKTWTEENQKRAEELVLAGKGVHFSVRDDGSIVEDNNVNPDNDETENVEGCEKTNRADKVSVGMKENKGEEDEWDV